MKWLLVLILAVCAPAFAQTTIYVSKCGPQAAAGCIPGSNSNPGTDPAAPKLDYVGQVSLSSIAAGSTVRLACGGHWENPGQWYAERVTDLNLMVEPYQHPGGGAPVCNITSVPTKTGTNGYSASDTRPRITFSDDSTWVYCQGGSCNGLYARNIRVTSTGSASSAAFFLWAPSERVTIEGMVIDGFAVPIVPNTNTTTGDPIHRWWTVRNNYLANGAHGWLGGASESLVEGNYITRMNRHTGDAIGGQQHAMYWTCPANLCRGTLIRNNYLHNNSINISTGETYSGKCNGGNFTARGRVEDLVFDGNTIVNDEGGSTLRCYGYSIGAGYSTPSPLDYGYEYWRRGVIRNTTIVGVGTAVAMTTASDMLVENVRAIFTPAQAGDFASGLRIPHRDYDAVNNDELDARAVVRNFLCYWSDSPGAGSYCANTVSNGSNTMGTGVQLTNIHAHFGANANNADAFYIEDVPANYARIQGLAVTGSNRLWHPSYTTLSAFNTRFNDRPSGAVAGAVDAASADFATTPSSGNGWTCSFNSGSPLVNAGSSAGARLGPDRKLRVGNKDIGACEDR